MLVGNLVLAMKIITKYIASGLLRYLALTLFSLVALVVVAEFIGSMNRIVSSWQAFASFADETWRSVPARVEELLPISVLLATMFTFRNLSRSVELTAMKISGAGRGQLLRQVLIVIIPVAVASYLNQNYLYAYLNPLGEQEAQRVDDQYQWRGFGDSLVYVERIDPRRRTLKRIRVFHAQKQPYRIDSFERMETGSRSKGRWRFREVARRRQHDGRWTSLQLPRTSVPKGDFPDVFKPVEPDARHMPFMEVYQEIQLHLNQPHRVALYQMEWYQKHAVLFALFVMALIGVSITQGASQKGKGGAEIILTLVAGVVFWLLTEIFFALGKGGYLPPLLAVWAPNVFFFTVAMTHYYRTP